MKVTRKQLEYVLWLGGKIQSESDNNSFDDVMSEILNSQLLAQPENGQPSTEWQLITILRKLQESGCQEPEIAKLQFGLGWEGFSVELGRGLIYL